jgi:hypothetical protein
MENENENNAANDAANNNNTDNDAVIRVPEVPDTPPSLTDMFITSTDSLRQRTINQKIPPSWSDRPPLFAAKIPSSFPRLPYLWRKPPPQEDPISMPQEEDPNLLKGVSFYFILYCIVSC